MITFIYYLFCAYVGILLIWNFMETRDVYQEILYAFVVMPFVLRFLRLK